MLVLIFFQVRADIAYQHLLISIAVRLVESIILLLEEILVAILGAGIPWEFLYLAGVGVLRLVCIDRLCLLLEVVEVLRVHEQAQKLVILQRLLLGVVLWLNDLIGLL